MKTETKTKMFSNKI